MKRVLSFALVSAAAMGFSTIGASAAPISVPKAPVEAASDVHQVGSRRHHHRRHYHRHHRHSHGRRHYRHRYYSYRPYRRDYYYGSPYVGIDLPFLGLSIGGHRHHRHRHW
jgi:hypothetical protein